MEDIPLSPIEQKFYDCWVQSGLSRLCPLLAQYPIGRYRVDFAHPTSRTVIELDGFATHSSTDDIEKDRKRQREIERLDWRVIRFGGREIHYDVRACVEEVRIALGIPSHIISYEIWVIIRLQETDQRSVEKDIQFAQEIYHIIQTYPGDDKYYLLVDINASTWHMTPNNNTVYYSQDLHNKLVELLGDRGVLKVSVIDKWRGNSYNSSQG